MTKSDQIKAIESKLRRAYESRHQPGSRIALPTENGITFDDDGNTVRIGLSSTNVMANMQTNGAAFEAWALALHVWLDGRRVELDWQAPSTPTTGSDDQGHYQRFLYRVRRFHDLFGDTWLSVPKLAEASSGLAFTCENPIVNVAGARSKVHLSVNAKPEAQAEAAWLELMSNADDRSHFASAGRELSFAYRQFPVGLFKGPKPTKRNAIFTGGKSAIDLIGIDDESVTVVELKAGTNQSLGKLSELMFYIHFLRDASGTAPLFRFFAPSSENAVRDRLADCKWMNAVLLVEAFHPLLRHPAFKTLLEGAFAKTGLPVHFFAWQYTMSDAANEGDAKAQIRESVRVPDWL